MDFVYVVGSNEHGKFIVDRVFSGDEIGFEDARDYCLGMRRKDKSNPPWNVMKAPFGGYWIDWDYVHLEKSDGS